VLALKNLLRRKVRSLFAVLQIAVAIAAFVSIVGVTKGLRSQFYKIGQTLAYDVMIQPGGAASPLFATVTQAEAEVVRGVEGVQGVSLLGIYATLAKGRPQPLLILALDPGEHLLEDYTILEGRQLRVDDGHAAIVGKLMAEEMGLQVGDSLELGYEAEQTVEVVGIFESPVSDVPFLSGQAVMSMHHYTTFYKLAPRIMVAHTALGETAETPEEVKLAAAQAKEVAPRIEAALPRMRARNFEEMLDSYKQSELVDSFALAIAFLAALVSAIGVANTMLMSVFDRTREIGLLRAIGWPRRQIVLMIEVEGLLLALGGGLLGLPLGVLLIEASKILIGLGWLDVTLDPPLYAQAVGFAALIGAMGAFYPAVRAAYLQPTDALRYE
jgi:putative ABC transport system permease protein